MNVGQRDLDALVRGDIDASDTRHVRLSSGYHGGKTPLGRRPKDDPTDYRHDHRQANATPPGLSLGVAVPAPRHAASTRSISPVTSSMSAMPSISASTPRSRS